jgi:hypothetical protein
MALKWTPYHAISESPAQPGTCGRDRASPKKSSPKIAFNRIKLL